MPELARICIGVLPLAWLLFALGFWRIPAWAAGAVALGLALLGAAWAFEFPVTSAYEAVIEGASLAVFPILWVVLTALFLYRVSVKSGSIEVIRAQLSALSDDRRLQALILAFGFGGFLEAAAGFGTAVAIPAAMMIALGFPAFLAATTCLLANTVPVAFGVIGIPVITLAQVTGLPLAELARLTALQLIPFVIGLPVVLVAHVAGGPGGLRGVLGPALAAGLAFAAVQTLVAFTLGPELPALLGSLASLAVLVVWLRLGRSGPAWRFADDLPAAAQAIPGTRAALMAWLPYLLILFLIAMTRLVPDLAFLNKPPFAFSLSFFSGQGGKTLFFNLITSGGTIMLFSAMAGGLVQGLTLRALGGVFLDTLRSLFKTILAVLAIVALARVMDYSGMIRSVAAAAAALSGPVFPLLSPLLGALGTFLTGTDTSSNVIFGGLQADTAARLGLAPVWLAAANAAGATAGKMISPQSLAIAASSTGLEGREGELVRVTIRYCLAYGLAMGMLVLLVSAGWKGTI